MAQTAIAAACSSKDSRSGGRGKPVINDHWPRTKERHMYIGIGTALLIIIILIILL
jgi:hypothetical protein